MISEFREKEGTTVIEKTNYGGYEGDYGNRGGSTRGRANAGLTLGIIGTVLGAAALWNRNGSGLGSILNGGGSNGGGSSPSNVNINCDSGGPSTSTFGVFEKECADVLALTNLVWSKASAAREVDVAEKFSLYNSQITADFGLYKDNRDNIDRVNNRINNELFSLYKYTRDKDDETRKELCDLKAQVAIANAVRPYQDKLIQCEIDKAFTAGINYVDRKTCRMISGQLVLPSTPLVTGYAGYNCCNQFLNAAAEGGAGA
jgi:hypothetical protein